MSEGAHQQLTAALRVSAGAGDDVVRCVGA